VRCSHVRFYVNTCCNVTYANDALGSDQLDKLVLGRALGVTLAIEVEVAKVTNVALLVGRSTVGGVVRVDCR
jgi:hypothetical protein